MTIADFTKEIEQLVGQNKKLNLEKFKTNNARVNLNDSEVNRIFIGLSEIRKTDPDYLASNAVSICKNPSSNNGKIIEVLSYDWLMQRFPDIKFQCDINQKDCYKLKDGYKADGQFESVVFDIKTFGIGFPHYKDLERHLQKLVDKTNMGKFLIMVSGNGDVSTDDIEQHNTQASSIVDELFKHPLGPEENPDYLMKLDDLGIEVRAYNEKNKRNVYIGENYTNRTAWAEENQYHFFRHSSQFLINNPYMIICAYDHRLVPWLGGGDKLDIYYRFRFFARRMFMNLIHDSDHEINFYDKNAREGVNVSEAARKVSAVLFVDLEADSDMYADMSWLFVNPNADNPIYNYIAGCFQDCGSLVDDFMYDNY